MKPGNGVPTASDRRRGLEGRDDRHLRAIEELVAKLQRVSRQLAFPARTLPTVSPGEVPPPGGPLRSEMDAD